VKLVDVKSTRFCEVPHIRDSLKFALEKLIADHFKEEFKITPGMLASSKTGLINFFTLKETPPRFALKKLVFSTIA
jgi:hypothetical protein